MPLSRHVDQTSLDGLRRRSRTERGAAQSNVSHPVREAEQRAHHLCLPVALNSAQAELFTPPPKVDSQILILNKRDEPLFDDVDTKQFFRVVKAGFSQRRKTLENSLSAGLHLSKDQAKEMLDQAGIEPNTRPQNLSLADWHKLSLAS